jgi:hypothetical protein
MIASLTGRCPRRFSITNSTMIVVFLTVMVAMILVRTLSQDIAHYYDAALLDEAKEESGWKLVHADVFRPPSFSPMLFSVCIGSGVQLGCMVLLTLTFALFGFLSPANRGSLITALLMLYVFAGGAGGHAAARLYKSFRGTDWMLNTLLTATLVPGFTFACFLVIDISLLSVGSSGAVPVSTLLTLVVLWFGVSVPLVFLGAYVGFKKDVSPNPVRSRRPVVLWWFHFIQTTRVHLTMKWVVSFLNSRPFGPLPVNTMLRAGENEPNSSLGAAAALVHAPCIDLNFRGHPAVRCCFCRIIFCHERDLAPPDILYFWVSIFGEHDPRGDLCGDNDTPMLLPALQRGLRVVVALRYEFGSLCGLRVLVCGLVFYKRAGNNRRSPVDPILRVHDAGERHLLFSYWCHWVLCLFMVREQDLWQHQGRLGPLPFFAPGKLGYTVTSS